MPDAPGAPPRVRLLSLGGTIAMGRADAGGGVSHSLEADDLVAAVPALGRLAAVEPEALRSLPGAQLSLGDVAEAALAARRAFAAGVAGVVLTQGTDTIDETAFLLELLGAAEAGPVVVTGAMRNPTLPGGDGPANLVAAVATAASDAARGLGVLVVMNDEIHAARFVAKRHTTSASAFASYPGPIGWLSEDRPLVLARPVGDLALPAGQRATLLARAAPVGADRLPEVAIVRTALGDGPRLLEAAAAAGFDGLVVEAAGAGHVSVAAARLLGELAQSVPVVIASRVGAGALLRSTYGFEGGEIDLARRGLIGAGWLPAGKARLLLLALLAAGAGQSGIAASFSAFSG